MQSGYYHLVWARFIANTTIIAFFCRWCGWVCLDLSGGAAGFHPGLVKEGSAAGVANMRPTQLRYMPTICQLTELQ